jgi:pimeloyl-ACP methyl ester carboxylesterase
MGLSLGTLVATRLAVLHQPAVKALILDGAVEPYRALRRSFGPMGAIVGEVACSQIPDDLNSEKQIQSVACPILFIHGRNDTIGTLEEAQHLASLARDATLWVLEDCDHLDIITKHPAAYRDRLVQFLHPQIVR